MHFQLVLGLLGSNPIVNGGGTALQFHVAYHFGLWVTEEERAN